MNHNLTWGVNADRECTVFCNYCREVVLERVSNLEAMLFTREPAKGCSGPPPMFCPGPAGRAAE